MITYCQWHLQDYWKLIAGLLKWNITWWGIEFVSSKSTLLGYGHTYHSNFNDFLCSIAKWLAFDDVLMYAEEISPFSQWGAKSPSKLTICTHSCIVLWSLSSSIGNCLGIFLACLWFVYASSFLQSIALPYDFLKQKHNKNMDQWWGDTFWDNFFHLKITSTLR